MNCLLQQNCRPIIWWRAIIAQQCYQPAKLKRLQFTMLDFKLALNPQHILIFSIVRQCRMTFLLLFSYLTVIYFPSPLKNIKALRKISFRLFLMCVWECLEFSFLYPHTKTSFLASFSPRFEEAKKKEGKSEATKEEKTMNK